MYEDVRFGMIVSTIINCFNSLGKNPPKAISPLKVMGYEELDSQDDVNKPQLAEKEMALRMRLLMAMNKRGEKVRPQ